MSVVVYRPQATVTCCSLMQYKLGPCLVIKATPAPCVSQTGPRLLRALHGQLGEPKFSDQILPANQTGL